MAGREPLFGRTVSTELRGRIRDELARLERTDTFVRQYGEAPIALLQKHEAKLLDLHTRMTKVLSRG